MLEAVGGRLESTSAAIAFKHVPPTWLDEARRGVLLATLALAAPPFLQQAWNLFKLVGAPKAIGPVSDTAVLILGAIGLGALGLRSLVKTPAGSGDMVKNVCIVASLSILASKLFPGLPLQKIAVQSGFTALVVYLARFEHRLYPESHRRLWFAGLLLLWILPINYIVSSFLTSDQQEMLKGANGVIGLLTAGIFLAAGNSLRSSLPTWTALGGQPASSKPGGRMDRPEPVKQQN